MQFQVGWLQFNAGKKNHTIPSEVNQLDIFPARIE